MTYEEALYYIVKSYRPGAKRGFDDCRRVLRHLGNPHEKLRVIHVAGTNGKGSTCAFLQRILMEAGYKAAMLTSPHLYRFNERFNINGQEITDGDFARHVEAVKEASGKALNEERPEPYTSGGSASADEEQCLSYFEILTLMGFNYFHEQNVDFAIMETGMGGRLDATNIVEKPIVSVITSIGLDHTQYLGNDIPSITAEKGGIIKKNCPSVLYSQSNEVYNVIRKICDEKNSELFYTDLGKAEITVLRDDISGIEFSVKCADFNYERVNIGMFGGYQRYNAVNVLGVVYALQKAGVKIETDAVLSGLSKTRWPGRMEIVREKPLVVLEGAHNPDGAASAKEATERYFAGKSVTLVVGIMKDKNYTTVLNELSTHADRIILTCPAYLSRAATPEELYSASDFKERVVSLETDFGKAMETAFLLTKPDGVVFVAGSLYLIGDVKNYLNVRGPKYIPC